MHELTIAQNLAEIICQSVPEEKLSQAESVLIRIGKLSNILPEALIFCFDSIKEQYGLKNTSLVIKEEPLRLICQTCSCEFESNDIIFICKYCHSGNLRIIEGDVLQVSEIILREVL